MLSLSHLDKCWLSRVQSASLPNIWMVGCTFNWLLDFSQLSLALCPSSCWFLLTDFEEMSLEGLGRKQRKSGKGKNKIKIWRKERKLERDKSIREMYENKEKGSLAAFQSCKCDLWTWIHWILPKAHLVQLLTIAHQMFLGAHPPFQRQDTK